jgi:hypothetical protein
MRAYALGLANYEGRRQASATLFPSGYIIAPYMGRPVDVLNHGEGNGKPPMIPWSSKSLFLPLAPFFPNKLACYPN